MAIQNRRGDYADYDPTKMVEGEFAFVLSGDPAGADGQSVYASFQNGSAKRLATYEDMVDNIDQATTSIQQDLTQGVNTVISDAQSAVRTMQSDIADTISDAETAVDGLESDVASAISQAQSDIGDEITAAQSTMSGIQSSYSSLASNNSNQLYLMQQQVNTAIGNLDSTAAEATAAAEYATSQADAVREIIETGGTVASWNTRTGAIMPEAGDYNSTQITHGSGTVSSALAGKQNTLIAGTGISLNGSVISVDTSTTHIDPHNVFYGGTITAQGQGILAAIGSAHNAIEITAGAVFDVQYPLLYAPDEIENLTTGTGDTLGIYAVYGTATTPSDIASPVAYAPIYIVGTVSGTSFTVDSTTPYTQTLPNSEDGKVYMLVGNTGNSGSSFVFSPSEKLFAYKGSSVSIVTPYDLILKGVTDNIQTLLGNVTLPTTAQTVTGAIDELNSNKVSKTGDTMTGALTVDRSGSDVDTLRINSDIQCGATPSATQYSRMVWMADSTNNWFNFLRASQNTSGTVTTSISLRNRQSATGSWNSTSNTLSLTQALDGTNGVSVSAPAAWRTALGIASTTETPEIGTTSGGGYAKFPSGLLIQYGTAGGYSAVKSRNISLTLPMAFLNTTYFITGSTYYGTAGEGDAYQCTISFCRKSTSAVEIRQYNVSANYVNAVMFIAIGRWK